MFNKKQHEERTASSSWSQNQNDCESLIVDEAAKLAWELLKTTTWRTDYAISYAHVSETKWRCDIELRLNMDENTAAGILNKVHVPIALLSKSAVHSDMQFKNERACTLNIASRSQAATFVLQALDGALLEVGESPISGTGLGEALFYLFRQSSLLYDPDNPKRPISSDSALFAETTQKAALSYFDSISVGNSADDIVWSEVAIKQVKDNFNRLYASIRIFRYFVQTYTTKRPVYVVLEDDSLHSKIVSGGFIEYQGVVHGGGLTRSSQMRFRSAFNVLGRKFEKDIDAFGMAEHVHVTVKSPAGTHFAPVSSSRPRIEMLYCSEQGSDETKQPTPQVMVEGSVAPSRVALDARMRWDLDGEDEPYRRMPCGNSLEQAFALRARLLPEYRGSFLSVLAFFFLSIVAMLFLLVSPNEGSQVSVKGLQSVFVVAPIVMTTFLSRRKTSYIERNVSWIQRFLFGAGVIADLIAIVLYCWMNARSALASALDGIVANCDDPGAFLCVICSWVQSDASAVNGNVFLLLVVALAALVVLYCVIAAILKVNKLRWTKNKGAFSPRKVQWRYLGEIVSKVRCPADVKPPSGENASTDNDMLTVDPAFSDGGLSPDGDVPMNSNSSNDG